MMRMAVREYAAYLDDEVGDMSVVFDAFESV